MTSTATHTELAATAEVLACCAATRPSREAVDIAMAEATDPVGVAQRGHLLSVSGCSPTRPCPWLARVRRWCRRSACRRKYAAALGVTTESGFAQVGRVLELRFRLPRLWDRVTSGSCRCGERAGIAEHTTSLPLRAPHMSTVTSHRSRTRALGCSRTAPSKRRWSGSTRQPREEKRREVAERRHVDVQLDQVSFDGTVRIDAEVDLADALDLEDALRAGAKQQADLGSTESLDVRSRLPWATSPDGSSPSGSTPKHRGRPS